MNSWPKDRWVTLLQGVLTGTSRKLYDSLSVEDSSNYDLVKDSILRAYEHIQKFYRQQFRSYTKKVNQTYVEFSREKEMFFDRWSHSEEINKCYEKLKQLLLLDEFKNCVSNGLKIYLNNRK